MADVINNITLQELTEIETLSVRSQNVCEWNSLIDILSILQHYRDNNSFLTLRNCGQKSNAELISICLKYQGFIIENKINTGNSDLNNNPNENPLSNIESQNPIVKKIDDLTIRQKKIINNLIISLFNDLSIRSSNVLNKHLSYEINIKGLTTIFNDEYFKISNIRNAGKKSFSEIQNFLNSFQEYIEIISMYENEEELTIELFNSFLARRFCLTSATINKIWKDYDPACGIPLFKSCNVLIENEILFDKRDKIIFEKGFNYNNSLNVSTLEEIASILNITKERTRQIRTNIFDNLNSTFSFIKSLEFDALNLYGIDVTSNLIFISDEIISEINQKENNSFNRHFIIKILSILFENSHGLIGNEQIIIFEQIKSSRSTHNWNNNYLIKKEFTDILNFEEFVNDINSRLSERIEDDYSFHFEAYMTKFQTSDCAEFTQIIIQIAEQILFNEFEMSIDIDDNIIFKRNTIKQVYEYAYEALETLGQPSKVQKICKKVNELYPNYETDENSIRASMQRKNGFIPFGRTSVYGLKEWEEEQDIRGGTIRDTTEEFLSTQTEPKHIDEITEYVNNRYRNTNSKNIYANLRMEENSRFVFFKGLNIGLKSKNYDEFSFTKVKNNQNDKKTWDESYSVLEEFVIQNERLPYSSGDDQEQKLYRFFNIQLKKANKELIDEVKAQKINSLADLCNYNKRARRNPKNLHHTYDELKLFISKNNRFPNPNCDEEKNLYHFFYRQTTLFRNGQLSNEQIDKYLDIIDLKQIIYEN